MRVLVLFGAATPSTEPLRRHVERLAPELGMTPIFAQCTDLETVEALAATAEYRILPLDDAAVGLAARLATCMARPMLDGDPLALQDKWGQRRAFERLGVPSPPFALVETTDDVRSCGRRWDYPLMLKPVRGTESRGVRRVDGDEGIAEALAAALQAARATGVPRVLAEGYLDGPDVAVESMVLDGVTHHVAYWRSGWNGNLWQAAAPLGPDLEPHLTAIGAAVARANAALGLRWAATSNELRLTSEGPRIVEVNARLGGGPCEDAIRLHSGVDRVRAMLALLAGDRPDLASQTRQPVVQTVMRAAVRGVVHGVDAPAHLVDNSDVQLELRTVPGMRIDDPTTHFIGWLIAHGRPGEHADHLLPHAAELARQIRLVMREE